MTWLTIKPVLAGRVPNGEVACTRAGAGDVGTGVEAGATAAVARGEGAAVGRGIDPVGNADWVAIGSDAVGSGRIVAIGREAEGSGTKVATGSDADGRAASLTLGNSDGGASIGSMASVGPTAAAAADVLRSTNAPATTSAVIATAAGARPVP
jgi:hypothetical protein